MTTAHSKLPPSSAARRMACPGSHALSERYGRNEESEASQEGTLAHEAAACNLINALPEKVGKYTVEMYEGAMYYAGVVRRFLTLESLRIEERIDCSNIHPDMWGTADAWGVNENNTLHVFDYKFGHTPVDAFENWQLLAYACGLVWKESLVKTVYLHIVQPRDFLSASRHKIWALTIDELQAYRERLQISEALATSDHPELRVGLECKYCPARHACPALQSAAFGASELAFRDSPQGLTPAQLGAELKLLHEAQELLDSRVKALEVEAVYLLQSGASVNHYELKASEGRMVWNIDTEKVLDLGQMYGVNLSKIDIITPTQAIKAGLPADAVLEYTDRKQSLKLSKIDINKSKEVFKKK